MLPIETQTGNLNESIPLNTSEQNIVRNRSYTGGIFLFLSLVPAINIFFNFFIRKTLCKPHEDLLVGLSGVCSIFSLANLIMYITGIRGILTLAGFIFLILSIVFYYRQNLLNFSNNKTRIVILSIIGLQYILYFGLYRLIISFF